VTQTKDETSLGYTHRNKKRKGAKHGGAEGGGGGRELW